MFDEITVYRLPAVYRDGKMVTRRVMSDGQSWSYYEDGKLAACANTYEALYPFIRGAHGI